MVLLMFLHRNFVIDSCVSGQMYRKWRKKHEEDGTCAPRLLDMPLVFTNSTACKVIRHPGQKFLLQGTQRSRFLEGELFITRLQGGQCWRPGILEMPLKGEHYWGETIWEINFSGWEEQQKRRTRGCWHVTRLDHRELQFGILSFRPPPPPSPFFRKTSLCNLWHFNDLSQGEYYILLGFKCILDYKYDYICENLPHSLSIWQRKM